MLRIEQPDKFIYIHLKGLHFHYQLSRIDGHLKKFSESQYIFLKGNLLQNMYDCVSICSGISCKIELLETNVFCIWNIELFGKFAPIFRENERKYKQYYWTILICNIITLLFDYQFPYFGRFHNSISWKVLELLLKTDPVAFCSPLEN